MGPGEQEHRRQAEQGKVDAHAVGAPDHGHHAVYQGDESGDDDGQGHPLIAGVGAVVDPLGLGRLGQAAGQVGVVL